MQPVTDYLGNQLDIGDVVLVGESKHSRHLSTVEYHYLLITGRTPKMIQCHQIGPVSMSLDKQATKDQLQGRCGRKGGKVFPSSVILQDKAFLTEKEITTAITKGTSPQIRVPTLVRPLVSNP